MLIFEFNNGSIVNLLTFESLLNNGDGTYTLVCQSGTSYDLNKGEFDTIKEIFAKKFTEK